MENISFIDALKGRGGGKFGNLVIKMIPLPTFSLNPKYPHQKNWTKAAVTPHTPPVSFKEFTSIFTFFSSISDFDLFLINSWFNQL
jgi:hypothetical protein